jgi:hypothetical protein
MKKLIKQYTLTCEDDLINIQNGLCPDYALLWSKEENIKYWPQNHDFIGCLEKRLAKYNLKSNITKKNSKKVRFEIFKDIIFFDEETPIINQDKPLSLC